MFVSLHRFNEEGNQRLETLAADPVRRLPDHNERVADCLIIKSTRGPWSAPCGLFTAQHPHGVLAMKTGHRHELIQDAGFLATLAISVSLTHRYHQFISRRHGDPPHPPLRSPISVGSKLDEATAQYPGAFLARQCAFSPRLSRNNHPSPAADAVLKHDLRGSSAVFFISSQGTMRQSSIICNRNTGGQE